MGEQGRYIETLTQNIRKLEKDLTTHQAELETIEEQQDIAEVFASL